jgi:recombination protein U
MRNLYGKQFEKDFKKSIPKEIFLLRLNDGTASWSNSDNTRFQQTNPCDYILHHKGFLFLLELKSYKGKSIPFNAIRNTQLKHLYNISKLNGNEYPFIIFNFRDIPETYMVSIVEIFSYMNQQKQQDKRKSFSYDWVKNVGYQIKAQKKIVNYSYNVIDTINFYIDNIINKGE